MSEFKFSCPVCGQHITADSSTSGGQLECPTCFQKIIVPQAPSSADSKFIVSASQVAKPRPTSTYASSSLEPLRRGGGSIWWTALFLLVLCSAGAVAFMYRDKILKSASVSKETPTNAVAKKVAAPMTVYPVPSNITWTLNLSNSAFPSDVTAGRIHGNGFKAEKATLVGGTLSFRQGSSSPADLGVSVHLYARQGEELSGKLVQVGPDQPSPRVVLRWKNEQQKAVNDNFSGGYALKIAFGQATNGRMPGKIYLCLADDAKSFVAGTFDAEIKKPSPPKPKPPPK